MSLRVLTIRKIRIASGDVAAARRTADYVLDAKESPEGVARARGENPSVDNCVRPIALWLGSPSTLARLGVGRGLHVGRDGLVLALQGCNAVTGERVRVEGLIHRDAVDDRGRPVYDEDGKRRKVRVRGTKSVDLTFSAPKSVSVVWSQASPEVRAAIEAAMIAAADAMLANMTEAKPVVAHHRMLHCARGFAAAAALHVMARAARGNPVPSPQLHVHGIVLGVERGDGFFASPELSGMFKHGAPLEGGAVARAKLAEILVDMGFEIDQEGRFFEIRGVPKGLIHRMSGRTKDVEARIRQREGARGKTLTNRERAVVALETREAKSREASLEEAVAVWAAHAGDFDFGAATVNKLLRGSGFAGSLEARTSAVLRLSRTKRPAASIGEARAAVFESAAGRLTLEEAYLAVDRMVDRDGTGEESASM
jgi:conjugative relaxase-like TrwC/TraI family protein